MHIDILIIGQGICGSFLSSELRKAGLSFIVMDDARQESASKVASGIINPVTGRRIVKTWMIDELMPFALNAYNELGDWLGIECIQETTILDFFPTPQMRLAFLERCSTDPQYLSMPENDSDWNSYLHYDFGYGMIQPAYLVDLPTLLGSFRSELRNCQQLREECFQQEHMVIHDNLIEYKDLTARKVFFCDGVNSLKNKWFKNLPFAPTKGEALIVEIRDLQHHSILKKGINIVPWKDELFWVGSSHEWSFENDQPTKSFREKTTVQLQAFCKLPFIVVEHLAAVRPATLERRPFIGLHPQQPEVGIFNGMGTKGCSLAPFFARQLVNYLKMDLPLSPDVDVQRFRKVISRE